MKKYFLSLLLTLLVLSACSNQDNEETNKLQTETIKNTTLNFQSDYEKCKDNDYANLDFTNSSVIFPKLDYLCDLNITFQKQFYTTEEMLPQFKEYCKFFFGEYDSSNALFSSTSSYISRQEGDGKYAWYPKVDDYFEKLQSGSIQADMLMYRDITNDNYLWWLASSNCPRWVSKGEAYSFIKSDDTRISAWIPSDMDNKTASYLNNGEHDNEQYHLLDCDVTVGEAVQYFENDYLSSLPFKIDENYSISVSSIDVYNIKDDIYCYVFNFSSSWKGISFDSRVESFSYQDTSNQYRISGEALMIRKGDIDTFVDLSFPTAEEGKNVENIYTLKNAVDIVSDKLTKEVVFEVQTIEFVYQGNFSEDRTEALLEPAWKFILYNYNDKMYYCVYVNAESGKCDYVSYIPLS
ncbi:MAG: hypothetical protein NC452_18210 [Eubacterium sp.]|nr:hypothetical protein [Eubacterium sp.]